MNKNDKKKENDIEKEKEIEILDLDGDDTGLESVEEDVKSEEEGKAEELLFSLLFFLFCYPLGIDTHTKKESEEHYELQ